MKRTADAIWEGPLNKGQGQLTTASGVLAGARFSFATRFETEPGTNPEELVAAAHAGCFSMGLAFALGKAGLSPERIRTTAELTLDKGPTISGIHIRTVARVPGAGDADFQRLASQAKEEGLISRLAKVPVTLEAKLEG